MTSHTESVDDMFDEEQKFPGNIVSEACFPIIQCLSTGNNHKNNLVGINSNIFHWFSLPMKIIIFLMASPHYL